MEGKKTLETKGFVTIDHAAEQPSGLCQLIGQLIGFRFRQMVAGKSCFQPVNGFLQLTI